MRRCGDVKNFLVIVESPFRGNEEINKKYAEECMMDSLCRGESPFLSHLLYTRVLNEDIAEERAFGINAGLAWGRVADATVVYLDLGITEGMRYGIHRAIEEGRPVIYRRLYGG